MQIINSSIDLHTKGHADIIDLTPGIREILRENDIGSGCVNIFVPGSTGAVTTIEYESGALQDLKRFLDEIIPPGRNYEHDRAWGDGNGHSHLRAALLGPSLSVPVINGELQLGTWQQIVFIDCDNRSRSRNINVQIVGE
ncbi:secondary thiamine-phosphate synthase enzyme YjbQ [candidate division KSB1 bacterium]